MARITMVAVGRDDRTLEVTFYMSTCEQFDHYRVMYQSDQVVIDVMTQATGRHCLDEHSDTRELILGQPLGGRRITSDNLDSGSRVVYPSPT